MEVVDPKYYSYSGFGGPQTIIVGSSGQTSSLPSGEPWPDLWRGFCMEYFSMVEYSIVETCVV